ncbi:MAG: hypothetical protein Q9212_001449 [Teloschistes hypoglaucus]
MHHFLFGVFLYLSTGLARPTPDDSLGPNSSSSPSGFPASELPPLNISDFSIGNLHLPIRPATVTQIITYATSPFGPFDPGHLITSIIGKVYPLWRDTANAPILRPSEERSSPFTEVLHAIQPSLLAPRELTPLKISARISNTDHGRVESTPQPPALNNTSTPSLTNPSEFTDTKFNAHPKTTRQRAWLQIYSEIMFFIFSRDPYGFVDDLIRPTHASGTVTMRFPCVVIPALEGRLVFYGGKADLMWDQVAVNIKPLAHLAVSRDEWDCRETANLGPPGSPFVSVLWATREAGHVVPGVDGVEVTTS